MSVGVEDGGGRERLGKWEGRKEGEREGKGGPVQRFRELDA